MQYTTDLIEHNNNKTQPNQYAINLKALHIKF